MCSVVDGSRFWNALCSYNFDLAFNEDLIYFWLLCEGDKYNSEMATEHYELVQEMPSIERMTTQDRLKHAKKRRQQQLKKWAQYEKQLEKESVKKSKKKPVPQKPASTKSKRGGSDRVRFVANIALLESAARNDIEEGEVLYNVSDSQFKSVSVSVNQYKFGMGNLFLPGTIWIFITSFAGHTKIINVKISLLYLVRY